MSGYVWRHDDPLVPLVYEALTGKWGRYHDRHCGCGHDWITAHAQPAGLSVLRQGSGYVVLVGPGLTQPVGNTTVVSENALWTALTGKPGADWAETADLAAPPDPPTAAEVAARQAANKEAWANERAARDTRATAARTEPASDKQVAYLLRLVELHGRERFDAAFDDAVRGTNIAPRGPQERTRTAVGLAHPPGRTQAHHQPRRTLATCRVVVSTTMLRCAEQDMRFPWENRS